MKIIKGGVTAARGFKASSLRCGIKKSKRDDLALLFSEVPAVCTATFTTNRVKSGSVLLSMERAGRKTAQAVVVNSGNANCCVGKRELEDAKALTALVAGKLGLDDCKVLIGSTGIIGRPLPVGKIKNKIGQLVKGLNKGNGSKFAKAIMTTDTVPKEIAVRVNVGGREITIGGAVKGSGMICPDMATMLAFFATDAAIEKAALKAAFKEAVSDSFNRITVDGDMSTNDSAFILANGMAENRVVKKGSADYFKFLNGLKFTARELSRKIVLDGEGATKFVEVIVRGAGRQQDAERVARQVAGSSLVKTMIAGGDPNWGRVAASIGSSGVKVNSKKIDIYFGKRLVMKNGAGQDMPRKVLADMFKKKEIYITVDLKTGAASARVWTCDLTERYVEINAEYET